MRHWRWLSLPLGIAVLIGLVLAEGAQDITNLLHAAGWGLCWLLPFHALPLLLDAHAWRLLLRRRVSLPFLWWIATVREAINRLLPVASIGGEIVGVRLACWRLADGNLVAASVIVEVLVTMAVQYVFAALGLVLALASLPAMQDTWLKTAALALLLSAPIPVLIAALLKRGDLFQAIERWAERLPGIDPRRLPGLDTPRLDAALHALLTQPLTLLRALLWQWAGYVLGAWEVWWAASLLGHPLSIGNAIALEALTQAIRHAAFFIPGGIGVQEATVLLLAQMFGLPSDAAVSLALIKRAREVAFGCLALGSWQMAELLRGKKTPVAGGKSDTPSPA